MDKLTRHEFLELVKVVKMLYGRDVAERLFTKNIDTFYNVDSVSIINTQETGV